MTVVLAALGWTLFAVAILAGLILDLVGLFGNWIILGAVAAAWAATGFTHFGGWGVLALAGLAVLGEALEMVAAGYGASKFGGSRGGTAASLVGCIVGGIVGTPWFPIVGTLAGACLGAFLAATGYEYIVMEKHARGALWTGLGAALGKMAGLFAKFLTGLVMLAVAAATF